jgi:hypothetical protein
MVPRAPRPSLALVFLAMAGCPGAAFAEAAGADPYDPLSFPVK